VWIIVVSNIIATAICFLFLAKIARITQVRSSLVIPFILLLCYIGAFAENNTFGDVVVMLVFGALGWVMVQTDWPRPPLILGVVLGGLAEENLFLTIDNYGMDWLAFPSVVALFALMVLGTFYPLFQRWRERGTSPGTSNWRRSRAPGQGSRPGLDLVADLQSICGRPVRVGAVAGLGLGFRRVFSWVVGFWVTARVPSVESGYCRRCQDDRPWPGQST
jgi:hypothetical protein